MTSFTKKRIDVVMQLAGNRTFNENGNNTITLKGLRVETQITQVGAVGQNSQATIKIYGMNQSDMNKLSVIAIGNNQNVYTNRNHIEVFAGEADHNMVKVFDGNISQAWADYSNLPDVALVIQATPFILAQTKPANPMYWGDDIAISEAMMTIATEMGLNFVNVNVNRKIGCVTLKGTLYDQYTSLATWADICCIVEYGTMTICEWGTAIDRKTIDVSPRSGLIGVPSFSGKGLSINTLFNPYYKVHQTIQLESLLDLTDGKWIITSLSHNLESEKQGGAWFSNLSLQMFGNNISIAQNTTTDNKDSTNSADTENNNADTKPAV